MFININKLLKENNPRKSGYDFISVTKLITNENMGSDNTFKDDEIADMRKQSFIDDVGPLTGNQFVVKASGGSTLPFSTDFFLEAIDNSFIDTLPPNFKWSEGQLEVPLIVSSDYLELYNAVFAPGRDLPQLSEKTISSVNMVLECSGNGVEMQFKASVVALSDRMSTVLVPKSFLDWANSRFAPGLKTKINRIYIKTKDANDPQLISYIESHGDRINKDRTKFGRIKKILQNIVGALGIFGILVIVLALMLFSFYLQLMIAKSRENLQLLMTIGYSPNWLSKTVAKTWIPVYFLVVFSAIILTSLLHYSFVKLTFVEQKQLSPLLHWSVFSVGLLLLFLSVFTNFRIVKKALKTIGS